MAFRAIFFDLFWTLVNPHRELEHTECDDIGLTPEVWNRYVWAPQLEHDRAYGIIRTDRELTERICAGLPFPTTPAEREAIRLARNARMELALREIDPLIVNTLAALKAKGLRLGIISNADVVDIIGWDNSPLKALADDVIFSCSAGMVKPLPEIYLLGLKALGVRPEEALYVGDGGNDELRGAKAVGLTTVWTEYLLHREGEDRKAVAAFADHHIRDFAELMTLARQEEAGPEDERIYQTLRALLAEQVAGCPSGLGPQTLLREELSFDSFTLVFFISTVEDAFGVEISEEELFSLHTLGDVIELVKEKTE